MPQSNTIPAGDLDRLIQIEQPVRSRSSFGEIKEGWTLVTQAWAKYETKQGLEEFRQEQRSNRDSGIFTIRFVSGLKTTMRVTCEGETYDIESIHEINRREGLELHVVVRDTTSGDQS